MVKFVGCMVVLTALITIARSINAAEMKTVDHVSPVINAQAAAIKTEPLTTMEFVSIAGGCYRMGDAFGDGKEDEKPVHKVCVDAFQMGKYEVTNAQYRTFRPGYGSGMYEGNSLNDHNQPVVNVSWYDAAEFAQWLSGKTGQSFRLPTEAEWEYAARAGTEGLNYWGDNPFDACGFANGADYSALAQWSDWAVHPCDDGFKVTAPVGKLQPNRFGLFDMMGNAAEWVSDVYDSGYYAKSPVNNPRGPSTGFLHVFRGGSWRFGPWGIRSSGRSGVGAGFSVPFVGFRLVNDSKVLN